MRAHLLLFALLLPFLLILWGVAVWGSDADALWLDEWWTTHFISANPREPLATPVQVIERVVQGSGHENNPVGYYLLLYFWQRLVGGTDVALRLFSGFCILLSITLMYQLGRAVDSQRLGIVAAMLLGFSAFYLNYSHEMRAYALACLWTILLLLAYWRFMFDVRPKWAWGITLMMSGAGLLYTHYSSALIIGVVAMMHLFMLPRNRRWWHVVGLAFGSLGLFAPHIVITSSVFSRLSAVVGAERHFNFDLWLFPSILWQAGMGFANEQPLLVIIIVIAFALLLGTRLTPKQRRGLIFSGILTLGGIVPPMLLLQAYQALFHLRYLLAIYPPLALFCALVLGVALQPLWKPVQNVLLALFVTIWALFGLFLSFDIQFHSNTYTLDFRGALTEPMRWDVVGATLAKLTHPQDALLVSVGGEAAWAHTGTASYYTYGLPARLLMLENPPLDENALYNFIHGVGRVWLVRPDAQAPTTEYQTAETRLAMAGYTMCGQIRHVGGTQIVTYGIAPQCCQAPPTVLAQFGDVATMRYTEVVSRGTAVELWQGWQVTTPLPDTYSIGTYAFDAAGNLTGQLDIPLPASGYSCVLVQFASSAPENTLSLTVYDWKNGMRLPVPQGDANQLVLISAS